MSERQAQLNPGSDAMSTGHQTFICLTLLIVTLFCFDLSLICCLWASSSTAGQTHWP